MFRTVICCVVATATLWIAGVSAAQADPGEESPRVIYKKETAIDFKELDLSAVVVGPDGVVVHGRREPTFNPLVKLRLDFNPEMTESVHRF